MNWCLECWWNIWNGTIVTAGAKPGDAERGPEACGEEGDHPAEGAPGVVGRDSSEVGAAISC